MRRYFITLGAPTSASGKVISASSEATIDGAAIALEGDLVSCPACRTTGKIRCVEPRIPETWNGRNVALENDLCICRCESPPKLLTRQVLRSQVIKDSGRALSHLASGAAAPGTPDQVYAEQFRLLDLHSGAPLAGREYAVVRGSGKLEFGTCNEQGLTHVLSATAEPEFVEVYVQGPLLTASLIAPSGAVLHYRARICTTRAVSSGPRDILVRGCQATDSGDGADELVDFLPEPDDEGEPASLLAPLRTGTYTGASVSSAAPYELSTMQRHLSSVPRRKT